MVFRHFFLWPVPSEECPKGSGSVILLRPKIRLAPQKHDVISMPRQQYTNIKHIPIQSYHPVVSIMLRHMDQKKIFGQNLCCREVKIDKILGVTYRTFLSNATTFRNYCDDKRSVPIKHISQPRKYKSHLGIDRIDCETPEIPRKE